MNNPCVSLVGAGPGDPDLMTVKAVRALRRATVVLRQCSPSIDGAGYCECCEFVP